MEAVWLAVVASVSAVVLAFLNNRATTMRLRIIHGLVDGTQTALMQEQIDGLRRELVFLEAGMSREPTEATRKEIGEMKVRIESKQKALEERMRKVIEEEAR